MDQLTKIHLSHVCRMSTTPPAWYLPPPDTLSDNHLELAVHPRMNSYPEHNTLHCVRTPLTLHLSCHAFVCICLLCIYCFSPPLSPVDPTAAVDYTAVEYDYFVDDRTATTELTGKQSHSLPQISPIFPYISCTRHCYCCCYVYNPIQLHSLIFVAP